MTNQLIITGADGCVGTAMVAEACRRGLEVTALVHAEDAADLAERAARLAVATGAAVPCLPLELTGTVELPPQPGAAVVHSAGITNFRVERERAQEVNVAGTRAVAEAARRMGAGSFVVLGSLYASGLKPGVVPEGPLERPSEFANFYEESKWEVEALVEGYADDLAVSVLRPATVLIDDSSGKVTFANAVHHSLLLAYLGRLTILPGHPDTPLYLVSADIVADAIINAVTTELPRYANLSPSRSEAVELADFLNVSFAAFEADPDFRRRRVPQPLLADMETFSEFADAIAPFADPVLASAMRSLRPFAPQLLVNKEIDATIGSTLTTNSLAIAPDQIAALVSYLLTHGFPARKPRRA